MSDETTDTELVPLPPRAIGDMPYEVGPPTFVIAGDGSDLESPDDTTTLADPEPVGDVTQVPLDMDTSHLPPGMRPPDEPWVRDVIDHGKTLARKAAAYDRMAAALAKYPKGCSAVADEIRANMEAGS